MSPVPSALLKVIEDLPEPEVHKFRLPVPPTANLIWRNNYRMSRTYLNPVYDKWRKDCFILAPRIKHKGHRKWDLHMIFYFYYLHKINNMDADNRIKPLVDFVKELIQIDDRWLIKGSWERVDLKSPKQRKDHYCDVILTIY